VSFLKVIDPAATHQQKSDNCYFLIYALCPGKFGERERWSPQLVATASEGGPSIKRNLYTSFAAAKRLPSNSPLENYWRSNPSAVFFFENRVRCIPPPREGGGCQVGVLL
jgi:hypothetical protein